MSLAIALGTIGVVAVVGAVVSVILAAQKPFRDGFGPW